MGLARVDGRGTNGKSRFRHSGIRYVIRGDEVLHNRVNVGVPNTVVLARLDDEAFPAR